MRSLSGTLLAAQKAMGDALYKITLTKSGEDTQTYGCDTTNRIVGSGIRHWEGDWLQTAEVTIDDRDGNVTSINLVGYQGVISYGYATGSDEYSATAPLKVITQRLDFRPDGICVLSLEGKGNQMTKDKASSIIKNGIAASIPTPNLLILDYTYPFEETDVGKKVYNVTADTWARVTAKEADNALSLDSDIFQSGSQSFEIHSSIAYEPASDNSDTVKTIINAIAGATMECFSHCEAITVSWDVEDWLINSLALADSFKVYRGQTRFEKIRELLSYTACDSRFEADGKLHLFMTFARAWQANFNYYENEVVRPTVPYGAEHGDFIYRCTTEGVSGATEPTWTTLPSDTISDGSVVWTLEYDYIYDTDSDDHNVYQKSTQRRLVSPNKITVLSHPSQETSYIGVSTEPISYADQPQEDFVYLRLTSNTEAEDIAKAKIDRLKRDSATGQG
ncbi:hypothetical protein LCGC14_1917660, partial [marine sediment metagenome]